MDKMRMNEKEKTKDDLEGKQQTEAERPAVRSDIPWNFRSNSFLGIIFLIFVFLLNCYRCQKRSLKSRTRRHLVKCLFFFFPCSIINSLCTLGKLSILIWENDGFVTKPISDTKNQCRLMINASGPRKLHLSVTITSSDVFESRLSCQENIANNS